MALKHMQEYRSAEISRGLLARIRAASRRPIRLMEVCGTHTMSIFRSGLRSLLPANITLLSGPGCPVCVTAQGEVDAFVRLARGSDAIVTTFGDLMRVPGSRSSLQEEKACGADIRVVYSAADALDMAAENPDRRVVFLGVGFETTAPTVAATILTARERGVENFSVFCAHKLVPPALEVLCDNPDVRVDGFILPGHVSVIIGLKAYGPLFDRHRIACAVAGFEAADILQAVDALVQQIETRQPRLENTYARVVGPDGNPRARQVMARVFETTDAVWRGLGPIARSGLVIRSEFEAFDAGRIFDLQSVPVPEPRGCACGDILTGIKIPPQCPLYKKRCTPEAPVGPCMVSSEGTCAAYYRYHTG